MSTTKTFRVVLLFCCTSNSWAGFPQKLQPFQAFSIQALESYVYRLIADCVGAAAIVVTVYVCHCLSIADTVQRLSSM